MVVNERSTLVIDVGIYLFRFLFLFNFADTIQGVFDAAQGVHY